MGATELPVPAMQHPQHAPVMFAGHSRWLQSCHAAIAEEKERRKGEANRRAGVHGGKAGTAVHRQSPSARPLACEVEVEVICRAGWGAIEVEWSRVRTVQSKPEPEGTRTGCSPVAQQHRRTTAQIQPAPTWSGSGHTHTLELAHVGGGSPGGWVVLLQPMQGRGGRGGGTPLSVATRPLPLPAPAVGLQVLCTAGHTCTHHPRTAQHPPEGLTQEPLC